MRVACHSCAAVVSAALLYAGDRSVAVLPSWVGLALFYPSFYAFLANGWCMARRRPVTFPTYSDERLERPRSDLASTVGLGSFALIAGLFLAAPATDYFIGF